jgi:hypothetical protein
MNLGYDGYSQRTDGGTGGSGLVIMAWQAPSLSITQPASDAPSNSVFQTQPKVQLLSPAGASLSTTGVPVTASITSGTASLGALQR